jgi:hypothetical protein
MSSILADDDEDVPEEEVNWLLDCSSLYANAGTAKEEYINTSYNVPKMTREVKVKKRSAKFEKTSLESCVNNLNQVSADMSANVKVIQETQQRMNDHLERYLNAQRELIMDLSDDDDADKELAVQY